MRIRPRAKPVEIAWVNRSISSLEVRVRDQGRAQSRAHIASAGRNGFVDLRFKQGCGLGLRFLSNIPVDSRLDSPYAPIRTK